jgi:hypothetical protein
VSGQGNHRFPARNDRADANRSFSHSGLKRKSRPGIGPTGLLEEQVMTHHRKLLPRIVVKIGIKVKITIVRK